MLAREVSGTQIVLIYLCWMLAMVLGFLALVSGRELTLTLLAVWQVDLKIVGLIDKVVFFFFGVVGLCIIVLTEGYLRTGAKRAKLPERIGLVFGMELLALFLFDAGRLLVPDVTEAARPSFIQAMMSLVIGCVGLWAFWIKRTR
ncbi:MAG: hypothetical protein HOE48_13095 [Candidatus Latescibacteria bacterium]|mgnify:CR=1 FL=1|jgi:hypothetical protein|nr:hypothetical protein [Candidatus Latescibacterota bacterium]